MLVGIVPASEYKYPMDNDRSFDKDPIEDGRDPDKDSRLLNPK